MYITISVTEGAARALHHLTADTAASEEIVSTAQTLGVTLRPMHPNTTDPKLMRDFVVRGFAPDQDIKTKQTFLQCRDVLGAYSKPPAEEPFNTQAAAIDGDCDELPR